MPSVRILSDDQFRQLTTDEKYLYINQVLRYIVDSRSGARSAQAAVEKRDQVTQMLSEADYTRLADTEKIRYLESLIDELITTVTEAQRALKSLRSGVPASFRN